MRLVIVTLIALTLYLQYSLWYTRGGIRDVDKLKTAVAEQKAEIARLKERNRSLSAEVIDLKQGLEAIEERARSEMGMLKDGEVFFRITDPSRPPAPGAAPPNAATAGIAAAPAQALDRFAEGEAPASEEGGVTPPPVAQPVAPREAARAVAKPPSRTANAVAKPAPKAATTSPKPAPKAATTAPKPAPKPAARKPAPVE
ncbi:MAG: cell division protein FtsB [Gammaproteobacteria bacterium]|nr:cell division protein FtsB [Gammaproteobacteria bacterium]